MSSGRIVRRSITSASIPDSASSSAASRLWWTPRIAETIVTSPPGADDRRLAQRARQSPLTSP